MGAVDHKAPQEQHLYTSVRHSQHLFTDIDTLSETAVDKKARLKQDRSSTTALNASISINRCKIALNASISINRCKKARLKQDRSSTTASMHPCTAANISRVVTSYLAAASVARHSRSVSPVSRCCIRNAAPGRLLPFK